MKATFIFLLCFLALNFLVFIPNWLIGSISKIDYPKKSFFNDTPYYILKKILYQRYHDDFLRLIFELQVLVFLMLLFNGLFVPYFKMGLIITVMLSFIYVTNIAVIIKVFKKAPMLINDIDFMRTGFMVYKKKAPIAVFSVLVALLIVLLLSWFLVNLLVEYSFQIENKDYLLVLLLLSILLSLFSIKKVHYDLYHSCVSFSIVKHFYYNIKKCNVLMNSLKSLNESLPYEYIKSIKLKKKPNIIFIFLESYGSFALSSEEYGLNFKKKLTEINESLIQNNWEVASTLSESPVSSGGSWLSHSSILFGTKVKDIAAHEVIFSHTDYVTKLESMPKYLSQLGYKTTMTSTLSYDKNEVDWQKIKNAYPFDDLMLYDDFDYEGEDVPIFGDRFSIPDEYSLNFAYNKLSKKAPFFLTVSTINSHYNYISPIKPLKHWKDYNTTKIPLTDGLKKNNLKNYFSAMHYQFDYIHNFLLNYNHEDSIVVLIGDHQPPFITPSNIDKTTPIHVLSKDQKFINAFKNVNFNEGLVPIKHTQTHESFFSKLLYALNKVYGEDAQKDLPIFEEGINLY